MHTTSRLGGRLTALGVVAALAAIMLLAPGGGAQTPEAGSADGVHPAHIHAGSCADPGEVVVPLADVALPAGEPVGASTAYPVKISLNLIDMPLADLLSGEFAVNVHLSGDEMGTYIACGDVGGVLTPGEADDRELRAGLAELNDSGYSGVVFISTLGDQTEVNIMLVEPETMG
jgi:hypothetical protein